jgi:hypothetical protein
MRARPLRFLGIGLSLAAAALLFGCASNPSRQGVDHAANLGSKSHETVALPGKPGCFWLSNFDGSWTVLNESELIVYAPVYSKPYLVKLFEPVPTLRFRKRLGFEDVERTGMICDGTMDNLVVPHWEPHRIPIVAVRELTAPQARRLLAENHIKVPPGAKPAKSNQTATHE